MHVVDLASLEAVELDPDDLAELDAHSAEWDRERRGCEPDEVFGWLRDGLDGRGTPRPELKRF